MTLYVPFDEFPAAARRFSDEKRIYVQAVEGGSLLTLAHPVSDRVLAANTPLSAEKVRAALEPEGFEVLQGCWGPDPSVAPGSVSLSEAFIGAVAYESSDNRPGVWIDAFPSQPTQVQVIQAMFNEFVRTGEAPEIPFEEFVRLAKPTTAVVTPVEIAHYLESKTQS